MSVAKMNSSVLSKFIIILLFVGTVVIVQLTTAYVSLGWMIMLCIIYGLKFMSRSVRVVSLISVLYLLGYGLSFLSNSYIVDYLSQFNVAREVIIACSRLSLVGFIVPFLLYAVMNKTRTNYVRIGSFTETIHFPLIWRGVRDPIWRFLLIASCVVILSFSFIIDYRLDNFYSLVKYGILFALVNSVLEEFLWRGFILSRFVDAIGEKWGLIVVSIGFGMYHYSIGFPWSVCALFSLFGMLLGGIAIRSKGLLPVTILHFIMNILFVWSGLIF